MAIPDTVRRSLARRLDTHRKQRWPDIDNLTIRYRGSFAYLDANTATDGTLPLCRLRYIGGSPQEWGFAIYLASKDGYEDSILPTGSFAGTPEQALDCACGLYLNDTTAWIDELDDISARPNTRENL